MKKKNEKQKGIVSDISTVKGGFDEPKIACVASVSVWFRSKERGARVKDRAKNGASEKAGRGWGTKSLVSFLARSKPKIPSLGLSLLRNQTETLATQAKHKKLRYAVCQSYQHHHTSCHSLLASSHYSCHFKMNSFPRFLLR